MYYLIKINSFFPYTWGSFNFNVFANKTSILCTNVRGAAVPYRIAGVESIKATTFMPNLTDITGGFAIVSHQDILWASFNADRYRCDDAKEIIMIFE